MLNMIKLDWLGMKYYRIRLVIIPFYIFLLSFVHEMTIIPCLAYMMLAFSVNPFAVEEKGKLDNLYLTLPVTRRMIVNARFGLSLIMQFAGLFVGTVVTIIMSKLLYGHNILFIHSFLPDFKTLFLIICVSILFYAVMNLSMFPLLFKIGYAKGKVLGFFIPCGVSMAVWYSIYLFYSYSESFRIWLISVFEWSATHTVWSAVLMLLAAALVLAVSYILSYKLYSRREL